MTHVATFRPVEDRQLGDTGTALVATLLDASGDPIDIADADVLEMLLMPPDGVVRVVEAELAGDGSDGQLHYVPVDGDLDQPGRWQYQGHVVHADFERHTAVKGFTVHDNLADLGSPGSP